MDTRVLTTHVPNVLAKRIDGFASRMQRSRSWIITQALTEWVARQDGAGNSGFAESQAGFGLETKTPAQAAVSLKAMRENTILGEISWKDLRDAGRR